MKNSRESSTKQKQLKGTVFYLDLRNNPSARNTIFTYIKTLGGNVETFFDKRINYVVTDKPKREWPKISHSGSSVDITSNDSRESGYLNGGPTVQTSSVVDLYSRGKRLALKAGNTSNTTTDILELAVKSGIKILPARTVCIFCENLIHGSSKTDNEKREEFDVKIRKLGQHFIKFEDMEQKYRPICRELGIWPEINIEAPPGTCPFGNFRGRAAKTNDKQTGESNLLRAKECLTVEKDKQVSTSKSKAKSPVKSTKKPRVTQFCEICSEGFINTHDHINSEKHRCYVNNSDNYKDLLGVINSLPRWRDGLKEAPCCDSSDEEMEDTELRSSPPATSPTGTTFTFGGVNSSCKNSRAFLRLDACIKPGRLSFTPSSSQEKGVPLQLGVVQDEDCQSDDVDSKIVEASSITPTKNPFKNLTLNSPEKETDVMVSEQF